MQRLRYPGGSGTVGYYRYEAAWELGKIRPDCRVYSVDLGTDFVTHGSVKELYKHYGLDGASIAKFTREVLS